MRNPVRVLKTWWFVWRVWRVTPWQWERDRRELLRVATAVWADRPEGE